MRTICVWGLLGDCISAMPAIERMEYDLEIQLPITHSKSGIDKLFTSLPNVKSVSFIGSRPASAINFDGFNRRESIYMHVARQFGFKDAPLSCKTIDIEPFRSWDDNYIVLHPYTSSEQRSWNIWSQIAWPCDVLVVGSPKDKRFLTPSSKIAYEQTDLYRTAQYMRDSHGLVAINSSMMHLANVLNIKSVIIYTEPVQQFWFPTVGLPLVTPDHIYVEHAVCNYLLANS